MQPYLYLSVMFLFLVLFVIYRRQKLIIAKRIIKNKKPEERVEMVELAKKFIGKECLIYAFDSNHQITGVIKEVTDGAILVEKAGTLEAINLDFVFRIREFPLNKKGKKKSVILD